MFDANKLLECDQDQVIHACRSLYNKLNPLTGKCESTDQAATTIADVPRGYYTGLSQYASADSEMESDDSVGIQRMSLGQSGAPHLRDRVETIKVEPQSTITCAKEEMTSNMQGYLRTYLDEAIERFHQDQRERAYQAIYPSQRIKPARVQETYTPDVEMESVRSHHSRSDIFDPKDADPDNLGQEEQRRAMVANTETLQNGGGIPQRIRV